MSAAQNDTTDIFLPDGIAMISRKILEPRAHQALAAMRFVTLASVLGFAIAAVARAEEAQTALPPVGSVGSTAFVQASNANLRAQALAGAAVLDKPVVNTAFKLLGKAGDWCEVETIPPAGLGVAGPADRQRGFIACGLLSSQKLTLPTIDAQIARNGSDPKALLDWYARAFWVAPSLVRWERVGVALQNALLDQQTLSKEIEGQQPLRFTVPEFEAMKQRLAAGIAVAPGATVPVQAPTLEHSDRLPGTLQSALSRIRMPAIRLSLFGKNEAPVIVPGAKYGTGTSQTLDLIDALSASNGVAFKTEVTAPASYALRPDTSVFAASSSWRFINAAGAMDVIMGIWDVGGLKIAFDRNVALYGVTAQGKPAAQLIKEVRISIGYDSACSYSSSRVEMKTAPAIGYAPQSSALVGWAGKPMPGGTSAVAQIKSRRFDGESEYDLVISHEIDLDHDGIVDFLVWQGRYQPQISAEGVWEAVFVNVDGQWRLSGYNEDADCT